MNYEQSLFKCLSYRAFLSSLRSTRGMHSRIAKSAGCQPSYLTAVLGEQAHLTNEHVYGICDFLKLSEIARDYLFLLLSYEKTPNQKVRKYFRQKIEKLRSEQSRLEKQSTVDDISQEALAFEYYTDPKVSAVHILLHNKTYQNSLERLQAKLNLGKDQLKRSLDILVQLRLVKMVSGRPVVTKSRLHAPGDTAISNVHLANWRDIARRRLSDREIGGTHLTSLYSVSRTDLDQFRADLKALWMEFQQKISQSPCEVEACFNLDLFEL